MQRVEQHAVPPVAFGCLEFMKDPGEPLARRFIAFLAGFMRYGAGEVGLARAGGADGEQVLPLSDPLGTGQV